ncbi:MAG: hypothetical protein HQK60_09860, partial [Deltaproteobacteria bacterium]|nr:hypothetical protein [Deltaproteobacteria bacterium]
AIVDLESEDLCELWVACDIGNLTDVKDGPIKDFCDRVGTLGNNKTPPDLQKMFAGWERDRRRKERNLRVVK